MGTTGVGRVCCYQHPPPVERGVCVDGHGGLYFEAKYPLERDRYVLF